jgi:hypothetical protein
VHREPIFNHFDGLTNLGVVFEIRIDGFPGENAEKKIEKNVSQDFKETVS